MSETTTRDDVEATEAPPSPWRGEASASPAGPIDAAEAAGMPAPPPIPLPRMTQTMRFSLRQAHFVFRARRELGEVFTVNAIVRGTAAMTSHPDHVKSLFTAKPGDAPSLTGESPLRPVVGPNSTLTALGDRHMRQRKLLLPSFHGDAIAAYAQGIADAADREIDTWAPGSTVELAPRMQSITLDVIMAGIFGIEGRPAKGTPEYRLRQATRIIINLSMTPLAQVGELINTGREELMWPASMAINALDRATFAVIAQRRKTDSEDRNDILSILLRTKTEDGELLTDQELRDELLTLVLAGHETTANQLAWTFERLVRTPDAYERLRAAVRDGERTAATVEATIHEGMRVRPVIPTIGRRVTKHWRLGDYAVAPDTPVTMSILLLHHREDLYPAPYAFLPERFLDHKPGTYSWIPFGGGIRRCLGATLAMAEQRIVLEAITRRCDLTYEEPTAEPVLHRNVTMIPAKGARVVVRERKPA